MLVEALTLLAAAIFCWTLFAIQCRKAKQTLPFSEYNRLKYCCIALIVYSLGALDYLPKFGIPYYPLGFATNAFFVSIVAYAILVHQLLDINVVIRKGLVYSILVTFITATYLVIVVFAEKLLQGVMGYRSIFSTLVAAFVIALGFIPVKNAIQRWVDRLFFGGSQEKLAEENDRLRQEVAQSERLKSVAILAAGLAHEIKNPLTAIKTFTEFLPEKHQDPEFIAKFHRIVGKEVERIHDTVQNLLTFAKPEAWKREPVALADVIQETIALLSNDCLKRQIKTEVTVDPLLRVIGDRTKLKQAVLNLCLNSLEAMEQGGDLHITTWQRNGHAVLEVRDTGLGIAKKDLAHIFDPFFTTKEMGTGLGLAVVHGIVKDHHGKIHIDSEAGRGTTVRMELPVSRTSA